MIELQDPLDLPSKIENDFITVPSWMIEILWERWLVLREKRFKLKWGPLRFSFRWSIADPVIEKLIGPRPETTWSPP